MSKFNLGDVVIVNDKHTYSGDLFINSKGIITWIPEREDVQRYGVKIEGAYNSRSSDGYFYFPVESLKGEIEMVKYCEPYSDFYEVLNVHLPKELYNRMCESNIEIRSIDHVIFNPPATIVFWADGSKTVVKCGENDEFDPEKGLAMAITKKALGNKHDYYDVFWKFLPKEYKKSLKEKKDES